MAGTEFSIDTEADRCVTCGALMIRPWTLALAQLLGVRPETISRIENGKTAIDRRTAAIVGAMVEDRARGTTITKDRLSVMSAARKRAKSVVLKRIGSYEEQLEKLPPGRMREMVKRALADYKSGRVERSFDLYWKLK